MDAKLCATVTGATTEELRANRDQAAGADGADMVELRVDYADEIDLGGVLADRRCPVVVTCRPVWEGGSVPRVRGRTPPSSQTGARSWGGVRRR